MRAHGLMPVAGNFVDSAVIGGAAGATIGCVSVDGVMTGKNDGPVIIVKLSWEEERAGKAIVLCAVMSVVLVRRDGVAPEAAVLRYVIRQLVVMAEQDRLAVTANRQLRRNSAVKSPHRQRPLIRQIGMKFRPNALAVLGVDLRAFLRRFNRNGRWENVKALVRPILPRRTAFHRAKASAQSRI